MYNCTKVRTIRFIPKANIAFVCKKASCLNVIFFDVAQVLYNVYYIPT